MAESTTEASLSLRAITPLDGRYSSKLGDLAPLVSEGGLIQYRCEVELAWLGHLIAVLPHGRPIAETQHASAVVKELRLHLPQAIAEDVKAYERTTNHDVKAVEYALRDLLMNRGVSTALQSLLHFGLTSEDVNNLSYALMLRDLRLKVLGPTLAGLNDKVDDIVRKERATPMLSRTHGQAASPTTLGKEFAVFGVRLRRLRRQLAAVSILGKCNGAVGNFNAHMVAYPELDWCMLSRNFVVNELGLVANFYTTQIESHDWIADYMHTLVRINQVLCDLSRDVWGYISLGYFKLSVKSGEVGSSTMPHKVNPIDFENAEGNLGIANAMAEHLAAKLPVSRWQRDLSDSTVLRNIGSVAAYSLLSYKSLSVGLAKLEADPVRMSADLAENVEVLTEAYQSVMRRYGISDAYERMKQLSRGKRITVADLHEVLDHCKEIPPEAAKRLRELTPHTYTGLASALCDSYLAGKEDL